MLHTKIENLKKAFEKSESVRSEAVFALSSFLSSLNTEDKYQLFDLIPCGGGFQIKIRETKDQGDFYTHEHLLEISRDGIISSIEVTEIG